MDLLNTIVQLERLASSLDHLVGTARPQLGIVIDNNDPLGYQRVRCRLSDGQETPWAMAAMPIAGMFTDPYPIGSTVVLIFIQGDPCQPVVIGVLVNDLNKPVDGQGLRLTVDSASLQGKQIATLGAKDSRNDTLVTRGW